MSQLNISRNTFLEREELRNFQSFLYNGIILKALLNASYSFGMITNDPSKINSNLNTPTSEDNIIDPFVVEVGTNSGTIKVLSGIAITSEGNFIDITDQEDNISVPNDSMYYWVKIAYKTRNYEKGYVSINTTGNVSGTVNFEGKVRGQSSSTPVSIRFEKLDGSIPLNNGVYQIVNVVDNNNLVLTAATTFVAESNLRVIILGTLPLGGVLTQEQQNGLYVYDDYEITLVQETEVATPPEKEVNEYYIARVQNSGGTVNIDNTIKSEYWSLGNIFTSTPKTE